SGVFVSKLEARAARSAAGWIAALENRKATGGHAVAHGVIVVALIDQIRNGVDGARRQRAVELHWDLALVGGEGNRHGSLSGDVFAIWNGSIVGRLGACVGFVLNCLLQCVFALARQNNLCLLFLWSFILIGIISNDVFVATLSREVGDAAADNQNGQHGGNDYAKRARLFFTVTSFNFTLEMIEGF